MARISLSPVPCRWKRWRAMPGRARHPEGARDDLVRAPAALHRRDQREREDLLEPDRFPVRGRPRRAVHLSRARAAGGLCHAGPAGRGSDVGVLCAIWRTGSSRRSPASACSGERRDGTGRHLGGSGPRDGRREDKIAAIGVRVAPWVTFTAFASIVEPDLSHFSGIVPCGIADARRDVAGRSGPSR